MNSLAIAFAVAVPFATAGLVYVLARFGAAQARAAGQAETKSEMDREATQAERRAGQVMAEHRTRDDAAGRLSDGGF